MSDDAATRATTVTVTRRLRAPRERVFAAWLDPESMARWLSPIGEGSTVEVDPRVGGRFRVDMDEGGETYAHRGEYLEIERPGRLVFTWLSDFTGPDGSVVTVELAEAADGGTELRLTHERLPDLETAEKHRQGWIEIVEQLATELDAAGAAP